VLAHVVQMPDAAVVSRVFDVVGSRMSALNMLLHLNNDDMYSELLRMENATKFRVEQMLEYFRVRPSNLNVTQH
jgi:hypothetical protein